MKTEKVKVALPSNECILTQTDKCVINLDKIIILLREEAGHDFSLYKKSSLFPSIERRKNIHKIDQDHNYVRFLQENPKEIGKLYKELLIGVTGFFRDPAVWIMLKENVLSVMLNELPDGHILRAWVPACSTGEEAYSLAIIFQEALENLAVHKRIGLQIFATDLNQDAIKKARIGFYSKNIFVDVSPERLNRFFTEESKGYRLNIDIRKMVMFAPQNVFKDPPFNKLDFISCRNMFIFLELELQNKLIKLFNNSLNPGGILLLGIDDPFEKQNEAFKEVDVKLKIFKHVSNRRISTKAGETIKLHTNQSMSEQDQEKKNKNIGNKVSTERVKELEDLLQRSIEELQTIREEMQTSQAELKATNDKLQLTNEKQQFTNEKLNTSKQKMHSLNEKLHAINIELQSKVRADIKVNEDMNNLLNSTGIAILFLDNELNIRRFSDQVTKIFKLRSTDMGRPFTDLVTDLQYSEIDEHARQVMKKLISVETAVATHDGRWFNVRIMPYRTLDDHIDGLVMTFTDISVAKKLEIELKKANMDLLSSKKSPLNITNLKQGES